MIEAIMCLALNLYYEARDQPVVGQLAVGFSTMNRVSDKRYPDTVCGVVKQAKYHEDGATHYHATWIKTPYWADHMTVVFTIDDHIFYR